MSFQKSDGMNYAPQGKPSPVVKPGEFVFAAAALEHGHIYGQCQGLIEAGGECKYVWDADPEKVRKFQERFPSAQAVPSLEAILEKDDVKLVTAAAIPNERGPLGCKVMQAGKDYFTDKTPFTTLTQLEEARAVASKTGRKYMVYFSERLHVEASVRADQLIKDGAIGRVVQMMGIGPHRSNPSTRPEWFWSAEKCGGILTDIGSHQFEQFLTYAGVKNATVTNAAVANYHHKDHPEFEDWGESNLQGDNGATCYIRIDWLNPQGLRTWGDGRTFILGTKGYMEIRKYLNLASDGEGDHLLLVDDAGEHHIRCHGQVGFPFFGQLILDCLNRTENAMTQEHAFLAAELALKAQAATRRIE